MREVFALLRVSDFKLMKMLLICQSDEYAEAKRLRMQDLSRSKFYVIYNQVVYMLLM